MLTLTIFLPLLTGLAVLALPRHRPDLVRYIALAGSVLTLGAALILWAGFDLGAGGLQWRMTLPWIPSVGASYDVGVGGLSLALILLTAILLTVVMAYVLGEHDRAHGHAFLFLLLATGLIGLFAAQDLLLFYLFFEVGLVPMYFIVGIWGGEGRRYAALKFFLYTRAGSLTMLLGFLALYLAMEPHSFSLPAIVQARPLDRAPLAGGLVFLALLVGFGVKLPIVPLHNWLPDAHVEAPTEGSVVLAGLQLKMGGYGMLAVLLPTLPETVARFGWGLVALALASLLYGALAALAQSDMKRLVAYTSVNHMGFVTLGVAVAALAENEGVRRLALNGAAVQMVSHGFLTGGMFLMVGMLQHRTGTRDLDRFGGLISAMPAFSGLFGLLAFGSLGLPGLSGFIAEFQAIGAALQLSAWVAALAVLALVVTTAVYLRLMTGLLMGRAPPNAPALAPLTAREAGVVGALAALSLGVGILPAVLVALLDGTTAALAHFP
ncbi:MULTISPECIES: complex I subunit 4 family protein [Methylobacterium]|jgi:NADH-quinone oxidoreductase subunit M|uniref:NADH-quinone oxidoreductase subunit M n=2 Tax=Pseudomonadota TaxID=1224 RepID=A0AAJ1TY02_9HYPH|nr:MULTISPECIES: NADH-quinone oxidoreductase subunit M [Methylobacterium]EIZ84284.1 proton-translocating NADH-quinone oxidoreductase subunit M [Methylobacterium sp. GXF4]MBP28043.1 oxidoreductase [Methylobacterium sp.]MBP32538.1 oxidoreductase [Methylobacterium sp.]MDH2312576.1 NADH-quinone oxidoreductase subunit M [Methylobacterium brachiatum]MDQ0546849.1 NADH-quinone oxidoreductase subunit M [Methylobacterium brachiatum]